MMFDPRVDTMGLKVCVCTRACIFCACFCQVSLLSTSTLKAFITHSSRRSVFVGVDEPELTQLNCFFFSLSEWNSVGGESIVYTSFNLSKYYCCLHSLSGTTDII